MAKRGMGIHVHELVDLAAASKLHYGILRLWDTGTGWLHLEPGPGKWNFSRLDGFVDAAARAGADVIMTLGQTPAWASSAPLRTSPYGPGASAPPQDMKSWEAHLRVLVQRYRGRIKYWELWNEVNDPKFYSGTVGQLADMARIASRILREAGDGVLLAPSIQGGALKEFRALAASEVMSVCDVASYHFYAPFDGPEVSYARMLEVRRILDASGHSKMPLWNTEVGWLVSLAGQNRVAPDWAKGWRVLDGRAAGAFLVRLAALQIAANVPVLAWYGWDNRAMGMGGAGGAAGSPEIIAAFNFCSDTLMAADSVCVSNDAGLWSADIRIRQLDLRLIWAERGLPDIATPAGYVPMPIPGLSMDAAPSGDRLASAATIGLPLLFRKA